MDNSVDFMKVRFKDYTKHHSRCENTTSVEPHPTIFVTIKYVDYIVSMKNVRTSENYTGALKPRKLERYPDASGPKTYSK